MAVSWWSFGLPDASGCAAGSAWFQRVGDLPDIQPRDGARLRGRGAHGERRRVILVVVASQA